MRWEKLGRIFDPTEHRLADGCSLFAKSPQAVEFDDYVRIYFSSQKQSANGKYVACPQFADFSKDFQRVLRVSREPLIELGRLGEFDEHGIFPFSPVRHDGKILAYTTGWSRRVSVSIDMNIGLAVSDNGGTTFKKVGSGGPVMAATPDEPLLVGDAFVRHFGRCFHMWYIFGDRWIRREPGAEPERRYRIAHAESYDGVAWRRDGKYIVETASPDECQALPTVFAHRGAYHMVFCYRSAFDFRADPAKAYRLGHAVSDDLKNWRRDDAGLGIDVSGDGWDSEMQCYPNVFTCNGQTFLLYNGNQFGKYGFGLARLID